MLDDVAAVKGGGGEEEQTSRASTAVKDVSTAVVKALSSPFPLHSSEKVGGSGWALVGGGCSFAFLALAVGASRRWWAYCRLWGT